MKLFNLSSMLSGIAVAAFLFSGCKKNDSNETSGVNVHHLFVSLSAPTATRNLQVFLKADSSKLAPTYQYANGALDANGIAHDTERQLLFQLSRTKKQILIYEQADSLKANSLPERSIDDATLTSGRGIAYDSKNNILYVANNTDSTIHAYINADAIRGVPAAMRTYKVSAEPWGITYDAKNARLLVAMDKGARKIEVFNSPELLAAGAVTANAVYTINAGAALDTNSRLHGIHYAPLKDALLVTDIGSASENGDGAIYIIDNFSTKQAGALVPTRIINGKTTQLGNPVDVTMDQNLSIMYVAEQANGSVLSFNYSTNGNAAPRTSYNVSSPQAVCVAVY